MCHVGPNRANVEPHSYSSLIFCPNNRSFTDFRSLSNNCSASPFVCIVKKVLHYLHCINITQTLVLKVLFVKVNRYLCSWQPFTLEAYATVTRAFYFPCPPRNQTVRHVAGSGRTSLSFGPTGPFSEKVKAWTLS